MDVKPQPLPKLTGLYVRNLAANLIGNLTIALLNIFTPLDFLKDWRAFLAGGGWTLIPIFIFGAGMIVSILQFWIQRPISSYLSSRAQAEKIHNPLELKARQRLLNLPVFLCLTNLFMWLFLNIIFTPVLYLILDMTLSSLLYNFFRVLMIGIISSFIFFFLIDDFVREKLVPGFFPAGQLAATSSRFQVWFLLFLS